MEVNGESRVARAAMVRELKRPLIELRQLAFGLDGVSSNDAAIRAEMMRVTEAAMKRIDDLSKIEKLDKSQFQLEPVAVRAICDEATDELVRTLDRGAQKSLMKVKYSNRARLVMGNRELLKSVVYNFLLDAVNYTMDEDGYDTRIELKVRETKQKIEIAVRDFGPALMKGAVSDAAMRPMSSVVGAVVTENFLKFMHAEVGTVRHNDGASFFVRMPILKQQNMWGM